MNDFLQTLIISCIPAVLSGIGSYWIAQKNASSQIKILQEQNKHDIQKLMEQQKIDIASLKEKYRLEAEEKDKEHNRKLELMKTEYELKLQQQESEAENTAIYGLIKEFFSGIIVNNPDIKKYTLKEFEKFFKQELGKE